MIKATHLVRLPFESILRKPHFLLCFYERLQKYQRNDFLLAFRSCIAITVSHDCEEGTFEMFPSLLKAAETACGEWMRCCKHTHAYKTEKVHLHFTSCDPTQTELSHFDKQEQHFIYLYNAQHILVLTFKDTAADQVQKICCLLNSLKLPVNLSYPKMQHSVFISFLNTLLK